MILTRTTSNVTSPPLDGGDTLALIRDDEILFFFKDLVAAITFQDQASTSVLCSEHHKLVCSEDMLSVTLKISHQQKSLRKREEEQCGERSCSAHQI